MATPLLGKRIVLTRSEAGNRTWAAYLATLGATTYELPSIETHSADLTPELAQVLEQLDQFDWVIFTSAVGVQSTIDLLAHSDLNIFHSLSPAIAVVGRKTAAAARNAHLQVAFQPTTPTSTALAAELSPVVHKKILLLHSNIASDNTATILRRRNAIVTDISVYQTRVRADQDPDFSRLLKSHGVDYLTFASPSAVRGFIQRITPTDLIIARTLPSIAIGPSVVAALRDADFSHINTSPHPTIESIAQTIIQCACAIT